MKRNLLIALALLIPVVIAGCILSGTMVFHFNLTGGWISNGSLQTRHVDLSENSDFNDNKDKLKSIDAIVIVGDVINLGSEDLTAQVYISDNQYTTPAQVEANATRIFVSPSVPANDTLHLDWTDGLSHMENLSAIEDQVKGDGQFYVYAISSSATGIVYDLHLIATITVGK